MTKQVEAVYEKGMLRPLEPLPFEENERVIVSISTNAAESERSHLDMEFIEQAKRELESADYIPTLEEVRQMLSKDTSSWADLITAEREDRF